MLRRSYFFRYSSQFRYSVFRCSSRKLYLIRKCFEISILFSFCFQMGSRGFAPKYKIDNPEVLLAVVEKRAEHERHYMIIKSLSKTKQVGSQICQEAQPLKRFRFFNHKN